jgi:excinuclease ABC subunit A
VTFVKAFDEIRSVFADVSDSKLRGFTAGHFSFNSELGRCARCEGDGVLQIDMQFLADIFMSCPDCKGSRYKHEILQVRYRDHTIADVLNLTVRDALSFFRGQTKVQQKLEVLASVGLEYLQLGQSATTLSAGEGQRLKLAGYLASASKKKTLFILDEPTTGLHTHDIVQLLDCFDALLAAGHSLIVVEHNVHLMSAADYIIDIGPGPADQGGNIVAVGAPAQIAKCKRSITAKYLRKAEVD